MLRSMFSAVSGLRNHQLRMDVIGNNIANVNTVGFKGSRATFKEMFSQTIRGAAAPQGSRGGMNPIQVGLGMTIGTIDTVHGRSSIETTGKNTDLAIDGEGYFIVKTSADGNYAYTRAGNFEKDRDGYLVHAGTGLRVQGWRPLPGDTKPMDRPEDIFIPLGDTVLGQATTKVAFAGTLDSRMGVGESYETQMEAVDSKGSKHAIPVTFVKTATNSWSATIPGVSGASVSATIDPLVFKSDGTWSSGSGKITVTGLANGADDISVDIDFSQLREVEAEVSTVSTSDGYGPGTLNDYSIDSLGNITGHYTNGQNKVLAQIILADFANRNGLQKIGDTLFTVSNNSGKAIRGFAGTGGFGDIAPSSLEMSNVDLSQEFTNMITTQRGFQANSRVITTSDEILQELVNLKR